MKKDWVLTWRIIPVSKYLAAMVLASPQFLGLFPFQMAFPWLMNGAGTTHWDGPPNIGHHYPEGLLVRFGGLELKLLSSDSHERY